jgi:AcrR family transcriptional regulator
LEVATDLFAQQGFRGTTTRQIAHRAAVNEALIFRHFPRKEDLYWAVIDRKCRASRRDEQLAERLAELKDPQQLFPALARDLLRRNTEDPALGRLLLFSALENHGLSRRFFRRYVAGYYETLATHIRKWMREGTFRRTHPLLAARGFLGMVVYHYLIQELFGAKHYCGYHAAKAGSVLADIWLDGVYAKDHRARRRPRDSTPALRT